MHIQKLNIDQINNKIRGQQRWFEHMCRMSENRPTKQMYEMRLQGRNIRGRSKKTCNDSVREEGQKRANHGEICVPEKTEC